MSIGYDNMYNISAGIFSTFNSSSNKKLYYVNHSREKKDRMKNIFPIRKYNNTTKENFIIHNLYINFKESPSSLESLFSKLQDLDTKKSLQFKDEIKNYKKYLKEDIERIYIEESSVNMNYMMTQYRTNKIKWFTLYFYLLAKYGEIPNSLKESRINSVLILKIEKLLIYLKFSDTSINEMSVLISDRIEI